MTIDSAKALKVLIVEDDSINRRVVEDMLVQSSPASAWKLSSINGPR